MKIRNRQRQRNYTKIILGISTSLLLLISSILLLYFNLSSPVQTHAEQGSQPNIIYVPDQEYTNEFSIPAPVINKQPAVTGNTIYARKAKPLK